MLLIEQQGLGNKTKMICIHCAKLSQSAKILKVLSWMIIAIYFSSNIFFQSASTLTVFLKKSKKWARGVF